MKKLFLFFLAMMMVLPLVACGGNTTAGGMEEEKTPASDDKISNSSEQGQEEKAPEADPAPAEDDPDNSGEEETDPMLKMLNKAGLTIDSITPAEATFDTVFDEDDDEISFYMEKETETDAATYINKVLDSCKAASDDGKLYEADQNFYMGGSLTEYGPLSADEINSSSWYTAQFGYVKDGDTIAVTIVWLTDLHFGRDDDLNYPVYRVTFSF